jgi:hypothetical protein
MSYLLILRDPLINTPLQRGGCDSWKNINRFSGFED